ncbi:MAG: ATP-binding cassette domain-containing protein [Clostridia bacterium]
MPVVVTDRLCRTYLRIGRLSPGQPAEVEALKDVSLTIEHGELFGLLGPNGAGKTTFTKVLSTLLLPSAGKAFVLGHNVATEYKRIRPRIGLVLGGERGLYWRLNAWDNLQYFADLYHVPPPVAKRRISELLEMVGLSGRAHDLVETYSRGMKQRLHIARSLVADPEFLIMDEPTIGLDPVAARAVRNLLKELRSRGKTILLTTHYMYEAEELCQRVAILHRGRVLKVASPEEFKEVVAGGCTVEIQARHITQDHLKGLRQEPGVEVVAEQSNDSEDDVRTLVVHGTNVRNRIDGILRAIAGAEVLVFRVKEPSLEEAYVKMVGGDALKT